MDFELASINAFTKHFFNLTISGCHFHFCQAIYRQLNVNGLAKKYETNDDFKLWVRSVMALALVPVAQVDEAWTYLQAVQSPDRALLIDYVNRVWFEGSFPKEIWNQANPDTPRTNNGAEGFHSKINSWLNHRHPSIYKLVKNLKLIDYEEAIKFANRQNGRPGKRGSKKQREKEQNYATILEDMKDGHSSIPSFLTAAATDRVV